MAFEEVKAKLGLDITPFERGLKQADAGLSGFGKNATKGFSDLKNAGTALATSLGLNITSIAENVARFVTGVSKEAETAFERMGKASDEQVENLKKFFRLRSTDAQNLQRDINEEIRLRKQASTLLAPKRVSTGGRGFGTVMRQATEKEQAEGAEALNKAEALRVSILEQQKKIKEDTARTDKQANQEAISSQKQLADLVEKVENKKLDDAELILKLKKDIADLDNLAALGDEDAQKKQLALQLEQLAAEERLTKEREQGRKEIEARIKRTEEETSKLEEQAEKIRNSMDDERARRALPSLADVASGGRKIGSQARGQARGLQKDLEKEKELSDRLSRRQEDLSKATTAGAKADAQREVERAQDELRKVQGQISKNQTALGEKTSDANPFRETEKKLGEVERQLKILNEQTLAASSAAD
jgi:hypothetical protein